MLTFDYVRKFFQTHPDLKEKQGSYGRLSYGFPYSLYKGKVVIREFKSNQDGSFNGYVHARYMPESVREKYRSELDSRNMICFRTYNEQKIMELVEDALYSMKTLNGGKK